MLHGRVQWFLPEELNEEQRELYDAIVNGPRGSGPRASKVTDEQGRLGGAFNSRLLSPKIGDAVQAESAALRFNSHLSPRAQEIVILETAKSARCSYEWAGHSQRALREGLSEADIRCIETGGHAPDLTPTEQLIRRVTQALISNRDLTDEEFKEAEDGIGLVDLFDIITLVAHYQHTAMSLRVWRVPPRPGPLPAFDRGE